MYLKHLFLQLYFFGEPGGQRTPAVSTAGGVIAPGLLPAGAVDPSIPPAGAAGPKLPPPAGVADPSLKPPAAANLQGPSLPVVSKDVSPTKREVTKSTENGGDSGKKAPFKAMNLVLDKEPPKTADSRDNLVRVTPPTPTLSPTPPPTAPLIHSSNVKPEEEKVDPNKGKQQKIVADDKKIVNVKIGTTEPKVVSKDTIKENALDQNLTR